jgi:hypothetical protein
MSEDEFGKDLDPVELEQAAELAALALNSSVTSSPKAVAPMQAPTRPRQKPKPALNVRNIRPPKQDRSRDALLTDFGKKTLVDRYLLPGESYQDMFSRPVQRWCGSRPADLLLSQQCR